MGAILSNWGGGGINSEKADDTYTSVTAPDVDDGCSGNLKDVQIGMAGRAFDFHLTPLRANRCRLGVSLPELRAITCRRQS